MTKTLKLSEKEKPRKNGLVLAPNRPELAEPIDPEEAFSRERARVEHDLSDVALNLYKRLREPDQETPKIISRLAPITRNSPNPSEENPVTREKAAQLVYVLAKDAIEQRDQTTLNHLGVKDCFFQLDRGQAFALAILCLEKNHENAFKKIIRAFPELTTWPAPGERAQSMSLIHLAARLDREEIVQYLLTKDKSSGELRDARGDTFLHTAVRHNARKVVDRVMQLRTLLFAQSNHEHKRPGDLEGIGASYVKDLTHNLYLQAVLRNAQARLRQPTKTPRRPRTGQFEFIPATAQA